MRRPPTSGRLMRLIPPNIRHALGLRKWLASGEIEIRNGRVSGVTAVLIVEGREEWLAGIWRLVAEIPEDEVRKGEAPSYLVTWGHMLWEGEGEAVTVWLTPSAGADLEGLRRFNLDCLASSPACGALFDLMPVAARSERGGRPTR